MYINNSMFICLLLNVRIYIHVIINNLLNIRMFFLKYLRIVRIYVPKSDRTYLCLMDGGSILENLLCLCTRIKLARVINLEAIFCCT